MVRTDRVTAQELCAGPGGKECVWHGSVAVLVHVLALVLCSPTSPRDSTFVVVAAAAVAVAVVVAVAGVDRGDGGAVLY